jgi:hypothetical protein
MFSLVFMPVSVGGGGDKYAGCIAGAGGCGVRDGVSGWSGRSGTGWGIYLFSREKAGCMAIRGKTVFLGLLFTVMLVQGVAAGGIFDFFFGTPQPTPTPTPTISVTGPAQAVTTDLSGVVTLLQSILASVTRIEKVMPAVSGAIQTGNVMLYDNTGNIEANADQGSAVVALPPGECDVGVYAQNPLYVTMEEMKDYTGSKYTRNEQVCIDSRLCRRTVTLDDSFPFLYISFRDTDETKHLVDRVYLAYRCHVSGT